MESIADKVIKFFTTPSPSTGADDDELFTAAPAKKSFKFLNFGALVGTVCVMGAVAALVTLHAIGASVDFIILVAVMLGLGGLVLFDIFSRRAWEHDMGWQIESLSSHHDRMVRELARNRNDLIALKSGMAKTAQSVEMLGRRHGPGTSVEAKMIETIVAQLSEMGTAPRAGIGPAVLETAEHILEMEMAPPPIKAPPESNLDSALNPNRRFSNDVIVDMIQNAVRHDTIDLFLQPIVSLPQRKARFYEAFARIRSGSGTWLAASRYMDLAEKNNLLPGIDNLLLLRCLQSIREREGQDEDTPYILNIASSTLHDRGFMGDLVAFLSEHRRLAGSLIFELSQQDFEILEPSLIPVLDGISRLGCRFSMDRVRSRRLDINLFKARHVRFVKLDASWIINESGSKSGFSRLVRFKKQLDAAGIDLIVEKIENEDMLRELLDHNIDFGQGWLFGKPDTEGAWKTDNKVA